MVKEEQKTENYARPQNERDQRSDREFTSKQKERKRVYVEVKDIDDVVLLVVLIKRSRWSGTAASFLSSLCVVVALFTLR